MDETKPWLKALNLCSSKNDQLANLLDLLQLQDGAFPKGLFGVLENLQLCLDRKTHPFPSLPKELFSYLDLLRVLKEKSLAAELRGDFPELYRSKDVPAAKYLHGLLSDSGAPYSALYFIHQENHAALVCFQQSLLESLCLYRGGKANLKATHLRSYSLGIRQLCSPEQYDWFRKVEDTKLSSASEILSLLHEQKSKGSNVDSILINCHISLDLVIGNQVRLRSNVLHRRKGHTTGWKKHGVSAFGYGIATDIQVIGDDDDDTEPETIYGLMQAPVETDEMHALGVEPVEFSGAFEFLFYSDENLSPQAAALKSIIKQRGAIKQIERQNQFLPLSTASLNEQDIKDLIQIVSRLMNEGGKYLALALSAMLLTGTNIASVNKLIIFDTEDTIEFEKEQNLGFSLKHHSWVKRSYSPPYATDINSSVANACLDSEAELVFLPEMQNSLVSQLITELVKNNKFKPFYKKKSFFIPRSFELQKHKNDNIEASLKRLVKSVNPRITLNRIERFLPNLVASEYESTVATYLFNSYMPSSSARTFYTNLDSHYLQCIYIEARKMLQVMLGNKTIDFPAKLHDNVYQTGARYCPTKEHVQLTIFQIVNELNLIREAMLSKHAPWYAFHNFFTVSCIFLQSYCSGIRSIIDPFVNIDQISERYGIATFQDKDDESFSHTRTILAHPALVDLAKTYRSHRRAVLAKLALTNCRLALELRDKSADETFFLSEKLDLIPSRPIHISSYISNYSQLPLNSNRKYLRTTLIKKGTSFVAADFLLGHSSRGEAIGHQFSTISIKHISPELEANLTELLNEVGYIDAVKQLKGLSL